MDSFEINKIIAAILLTALIIIGIGKFTDFLFYVKKPEQTAYKIDGLETATSEKKIEDTEKLEKVGCRSKETIQEESRRANIVKNL